MKHRFTWLWITFSHCHRKTLYFMNDKEKTRQHSKSRNPSKMGMHNRTHTNGTNAQKTNKQNGHREEQRGNAKHSRGGTVDFLSEILGSSWQRPTWQTRLGRTQGGKVTQDKGKVRLYTHRRETSRAGRTNQTGVHTDGESVSDMRGQKEKQEVKMSWYGIVNVDMRQTWPIINSSYWITFDWLQCLLHSTDTYTDVLKALDVKEFGVSGSPQRVFCLLEVSTSDPLISLHLSRLHKRPLGAALLDPGWVELLKSAPLRLHYWCRQSLHHLAAVTPGFKECGTVRWFKVGLPRDLSSH